MWAGCPEFYFRQRKILLFTIAYRPPLGPNQPRIQGISGTLSQKVKQQEREADHSPPFSAKMKKGGAISPLPRHYIGANFTFYFEIYIATNREIDAYSYFYVHVNLCDCL
jgi:hypothetical protein